MCCPKSGNIWVSRQLAFLCFPVVSMYHITYFLQFFWASHRLPLALWSVSPLCDSCRRPRELTHGVPHPSDRWHCTFEPWPSPFRGCLFDAVSKMLPLPTSTFGVITFPQARYSFLLDQVINLLCSFLSVNPSTLDIPAIVSSATGSVYNAEPSFTQPTSRSSRLSQCSSRSLHGRLSSARF